MLLLYYLLIFITVAAVEGHRRPLIFGRPPEGLLEAASGDGFIWTDPEYLVNSTITQQNDHFGNVNGTWNQRYQYNKKFFNSSRPLAFLMIGGESTIDWKWVQNENVSMMVWAKEFGAAVFQVEHRFYGPKENTPIGDQTTASLQLLTIPQALADLDTFIGAMNDLYFKDSPNVKWITFGGSYPGTLSAYFRETYPNRTIGAVSTSSAVHFFTDYYGYAVNTEYTYRDVSSSCADNIGKAFQNMIKLAYGGEATRKQLETTFNLCTGFDDGKTPITKAVQYFFSNYYGLFQGINQYTGDNRGTSALGLGVPGACDIMNNASIGDEMARVKAVYDWQTTFYGGNTTDCADNDYNGFIKMASDTSYSDLDIVGTRSWIWQTCTTLGYFQTTDGNSGIFGSTVPLDFYADQCTALFGSQFTLDTVFIAVDKYRRMFYDNYTGTKIVFPNGSYDPWKSLGMKLNDTNADIDCFMITGTAHCADMYPARDTDPQSLVDARKRIHDHLVNWIAEGTVITTTPTATPKTTTSIPSSSPTVFFFFIVLISLYM